MKSNILVSQYITLILYDQLVVDKFPLPNVPSIPIPDLTDIEENALRYVCGYMIRAVKKQIGRWGKSRPMEKKETFLFGLECMIEHADDVSSSGADSDDGSGSVADRDGADIECGDVADSDGAGVADSDSADIEGGSGADSGDGSGAVSEEGDIEGGKSSSDWLKSIDRGRLVHVSDDCYKVFYYMELVVRRHLHDVSQALYEQAGSKTAIVQDVTRDVDVMYYWDICQCELGQDEKEELLMMVVQHYVTVRGYSFARSLLEKFKSREKKSTQKSMPMRKKVSNKSDRP